MAIIETVNEHDFLDAFRNTRPNNFSYEALKELFEYYDNLSEDTEKNIELDVIAICCEWSEMSESEVFQEYSHLIDNKLCCHCRKTATTEDKEKNICSKCGQNIIEIENIIEELNHRTMFIEVNRTDFNGDVIQTTYLIHEF